MNLPPGAVVKRDTLRRSKVSAEDKSCRSGSERDPPEANGEKNPTFIAKLLSGSYPPLADSEPDLRGLVKESETERLGYVLFAP